MANIGMALPDLGLDKPRQQGDTTGSEVAGVATRRSKRNAKGPAEKDPEVPDNNIPLSVWVKDHPELLIDIEPYVGRSLEERRQDTEGKKIGRPLNAWMMYRKAFNAVGCKFCAGPDGKAKQDKVSKFLSNSWKNLEPASITAYYARLAAVDKQRHQEAHGTVKFRPQKRQRKVLSSVAKPSRVEKSRATPRIRHREILTPEPTPESSFSVLSTPPKNPYFFESPTPLPYHQPTPESSLTATPEPQQMHMYMQQMYGNPYGNMCIFPTPNSVYPLIQSPTAAFPMGYPPQVAPQALTQPEMYQNGMWQLPDLPQPDQPSPIPPVFATRYGSITSLSADGRTLIDPQLLSADPPDFGPTQGSSSPLLPAADLYDGDAYLKSKWEDDTDAATMFGF